MTSRNLEWVALIAVAIIAIGGYFFPQISALAGRVGSEFPNGISVGTGVGATLNKFTVNANGTPVSRINAGTCYIKAYATTIAASSTANVDCQATAAIGTITATGAALTGVTDGDIVIAQLSTTTAGTTGQGLQVIGANSSTTAGHIDLRVVNNTGTTYTWSTSGNATGTVNYTALAL